MHCVAILSFVIVMRSIAIMKRGMGSFVIYIALKQQVNLILTKFFYKCSCRLIICLLLFSINQQKRYKKITEFYLIMISV